MRGIYRGRLKQLIQPFPGYKDRVVNDFAHDPLVHFVERLRVYCQHYSAPHVSAHMTYGDGHFTRKILLPRWVQEQHEEVYAADFKRFRDKEREVLLLQLESNIEHQLLALSKGNTIMKKQAHLAIALYEQKLDIPLPERIKEKIFHLYDNRCVLDPFE
jgi:hypothetical protein